MNGGLQNIKTSYELELCLGFWVKVRVSIGVSTTVRVSFRARVKGLSTNRLPQ